MQTPSDRKRALILGAIISIVFVSCLIFILIFPSAQTTDGLTAYIYQDGTQIHVVDLSTVTESYEITVSDENGNYNFIKVCPGSIGITDASCPDKLCVHMGFQSSSLLPITCLPNKVVIRLERATDSGNSNNNSLMDNSSNHHSDAELDGITY